MIEENSGIEVDAEDVFDIGEMEDAGESEAMQEAAAQATQATVSMAHRRRVAEDDRAQVYSETDLVKRARALARCNGIKFKYYEAPKKDPSLDIGPRPKTDAPLNRYAVYDGLFDFGSGIVPHPHFDVFKGRLVDHEGTVITARSVRVRTLMEALDAAGMENQKEREVAESIRSWAMDHELNSLVDFIERTTPEWDGTERLETALIDLFHPKDTETTRIFGRYFWLSLYNRLMNPGSRAPISLAIIGAQDAGKSWFGSLICKILMNDPKAGSIKLDFTQNLGQFLRNITGKSIIANVGELKGFKDADLEKIKDFMTRNEDDMDFKFEDSIVKARQWITILDGNKYDGIQRDDTGNRRVYPLFCFQKDDEFGQPAWEKGRKVDFSGFKPMLWQIMAECREWFKEHGPYAFDEVVDSATAAVVDFSEYERKHARGLVNDDTIDTNLRRCLVFAEKFRNNRGFWYITSADVASAFRQLSRYSPASRFVKPHIEAIGLESHKSNGASGYRIEGELLKKVGLTDDEKGLNRFLMVARADAFYDTGIYIDEDVDWDEVDKIVDSVVARRDTGNGF